MLSKNMFAAAAISAIAIAAPAAAQTTWSDDKFTGPYVGASVGYDFQGNDPGERIAFDRNQDGIFGDTVVTPAGANAFSPGFCDGRAQGNTPTGGGGCENDRSRVSYYGKLGYDMQFGRIVVGAVADFGRTGITDYVSAFSTTPASYTFVTKVDYDASVRGRLGFAANRTLFYGTGGYQYVNLNQSFRTSNVTNSFTESGDEEAWGYTAGGGVEQKISDKISLGVEYMYKDVKADRYTVRAGPGSALPNNPFLLANPTGTDFERSGRRLRYQSIRATAAFRF